jgi:hypothetical protein
MRMFTSCDARAPTRQLALRRPWAAVEECLLDKQPDDQALAIRTYAGPLEVAKTLPPCSIAQRVRLACRATRRVRVCGARMEPHTQIMPWA